MSLCEESAQPLQSEVTRDAPNKAAMLQIRKVFVGGIPQTVDSNDLFRLFSNVGKVKKAWMQMFHAERHVSNARKHRGFGFVIFSQEDAVDKLLGEDFSRFVTFGDGLQLEIKRAVGKVAAAALASDLHQTPQGTLKAKRTSTTTPPALSKLEAVSVSPAPFLNTPPLDAYADLPTVPPFPPWGTPAAESSDAPSMALTSGWRPTAPPRRSQMAPPQQLIAQHAPYAPLPNINALVHPLNPLPQNQQDLAQMLLQAMPDHYDD
jgi:hypothetical protein